jgi:hypothetical protein
MSNDIGDAVPLVYTIADAATVILTVTAPDGTTSTPSLTSSGAAPTVTYSGDVLVDQSGTWLYSFAATGTITDAEDGQFYVQPAATTNVYTTLPELKVALDIPAANTTLDDDLQDAILVASRAVDGDCQRHFYQVSETRTLEPHDWYKLRLGPYMDLVSVTTLKTDASGDGTFETAWAATDYQLLCADGTPNRNAGPEQRPYQRIKAIGTQTFPLPVGWSAMRTDLVQIDGVWGWPQIPDRVRRATRLAAVEVFKYPAFGAQGMGELGIIRVRENSRYWSLIGHYRLLPVAVA